MNIISCKNCGVIMDVDHVEESPRFTGRWDSSDTFNIYAKVFYVCPLCKFVIDEDGYDVDK